MARSASHDLTAEEHHAQRAALLRHKVLSPLLLSAAILAAVLLSLLPSPSLGQVNDRYVTVYTPRKEVVAVYWLLVFVLGLGYCVRLAVASPPSPLAKAPGSAFPLVFLFLALHAAFVVTQLFITSLVMVVLMLLVSAWAAVRIEFLGVRKSGVLDWIFTDLPMKLVLVMSLNVSLLHSLLLAFGWYTHHSPDHAPHEPDEKPVPPGSDAKEAWIAFGVVTIVGLIDAGWVFARKDIAWTVATLALWVAVMVGPGGGDAERTPQVFIPLILLSILQLVVLVAAFGWHHVQKRREGAIRLEDDDEQQSPFLRRQREEAQGQGQEQGQPPQQQRRAGEIDEL